MCACTVTQSCPTLCDHWTAAHQSPLSKGFSTQEYWHGLPFPPPGDPPNPGINCRWILYHQATGEASRQHYSVFKEGCYKSYQALAGMQKKRNSLTYCQLICKKKKGGAQSFQIYPVTQTSQFKLLTQDQRNTHPCKLTQMFVTGLLSIVTTQK